MKSAKDELFVCEESTDEEELSIEMMNTSMRTGRKSHSRTNKSSSKTSALNINGTSSTSCKNNSPSSSNYQIQKEFVDAQIQQMQQQNLQSQQASQPKNGDRRHSIGWNSYEDERLKHAIALYGTSDWLRVANCVGTLRTRSQCAQRWRRCLDPQISKEKWAREEIQLLKKLVDEFGDHNWSKVAQKMQTRCDVQCRYMWQRIVNNKNIRQVNINTTGNNVTIVNRPVNLQLIDATEFDDEPLKVANIEEKMVNEQIPHQIQQPQQLSIDNGQNNDTNNRAGDFGHFIFNNIDTSMQSRLLQQQQQQPKQVISPYQSKPKYQIQPQINDFQDDQQSTARIQIADPLIEVSAIDNFIDGFPTLPIKNM